MDFAAEWEQIRAALGGRPRVDAERMMAEPADGIASIEAARDARNARNAAARQQGRDAYERARRALYGDPEAVPVAASAAWLWADPRPVEIW